MQKTLICCFSTLLLLVVCLPVKGLGIDQDESGYFPTTIDCDNSAETSVCLDYNDDIAVKKMWVGSDEKYQAGGIWLKLYGEAGGLTYVGNSHKISINGVDRIWFNAHTYFSTEKFGWSTFFLNANWLNGSQWNKIRIYCLNNPNYHNYSYESLYIGIDTTFRANDPYPVVDFNRSSWSNSWTQGYPDPDSTDCTGELMLRFYPFHEHANKNDFANSREDAVYIDCLDDFAQKTITLTEQDLSGVTRAQLFIWGYAWGDEERNNQNDGIQINNLQTIFFNAYDVFQKNCWQWGAIDIWVPGLLVVGQNYFNFIDQRSTFDRENYAIGVDTDTIYNPPHSWWLYNDGQEHQSNALSGELMVALELYQSDHVEPYKELYATGIEHYNGYPNDDLTNDDMYVLESLFEDYGWTTVGNVTNENVREGCFYEEQYWSPYAPLNGSDVADFEYHTGHGGRGTITLSNCGDNQIDPYDLNYNLVVNIADNQYLLETDISSDGLDKDTEWVWISACSLLRGYDSAASADSVWQTLLYHGLHYLFGYYDDSLPDGEQGETYSDWGVAIYFCYYAFQLGYPVSSAYILANWVVSCDGWCYYYHTCNANDYLWGASAGPTPDCYEHDDIDFTHG